MFSRNEPPPPWGLEFSSNRPSWSYVPPFLIHLFVSAAPLYNHPLLQQDSLQQQCFSTPTRLHSVITQKIVAWKIITWHELLKFYIYMCTYIHTYKHTYTHTCIHTYKHTYKHINIHTNIHTYIIHTYIRTYVRTYIHTYIHIYKCTYILICKNIWKAWKLEY